MLALPINSLFSEGSAALNWHRLTLIPTWKGDYVHYKMHEEVTSPFPNFNGATFSSHTLLGMWLVIHDATNLSGVSKSCPRQLWD